MCIKLPLICFLFQSVSELPELVTLNLANNRLHEYPEDLKYPLAINKIEELNLAGNDLIAVSFFVYYISTLSKINLNINP